MRVNKFTPGIVALEYQSDLGPKEVRGKTPFKKRIRLQGEALPPDDTFHWKRLPAYKTGDGDYVYHQREGSDHSHLKSFGDRT